MVIRVLNVAEKPSVAREITRHLGGGQVSRRQHRGSWVSEFPFNLQQTPCKMLVTAVRGHLLEVDFHCHTRCGRRVTLQASSRRPWSARPIRVVRTWP